MFPKQILVIICMGFGLSVVDQLPLAIEAPSASFDGAFEGSIVQMTAYMISKILPCQELLFALLALVLTDVLVTLHMHLHVETQQGAVVALDARFEIDMGAAILACMGVSDDVVLP